MDKRLINAADALIAISSDLSSDIRSEPPSRDDLVELAKKISDIGFEIRKLADHISYKADPAGEYGLWNGLKDPKIVFQTGKYPLLKTFSPEYQNTPRTVNKRVGKPNMVSTQ